MNDIARPNEQVIFLTGPNRGAAIRWRDEAAKRMARRTDAAIAFTDASAPKLHRDFSAHIDWGIYHRNIAMENGIVSFWFPKQNARVPGKSPVDYDHQYAAEANVDFGVCMGERNHRPMMRMIVGCENGYAERMMLEGRLRVEETLLKLFVGEIDDFCTQILVELNKLEE